MMQSTEQSLQRLSRSSFRSRFKLNADDISYIEKKGLGVIESHAHDFVKKRLSPAVIPNDGRQTPMRGHPVFKAQHACACCCRGCLNKWYKIPINTELTISQQEDIVRLLMAWINKQLENNGN